MKIQREAASFYTKANSERQLSNPRKHFTLAISFLTIRTPTKILVFGVDGTLVQNIQMLGFKRFPAPLPSWPPPCRHPFRVLWVERPAAEDPGAKRPVPAADFRALRMHKGASYVSTYVRFCAYVYAHGRYSYKFICTCIPTHLYIYIYIYIHMYRLIPNTYTYTLSSHIL